MKCAE